MSILADQYIPIPRSFDKARFVPTGNRSSKLAAQACYNCGGTEFVCPQAALGQLLGAMQEHGFDEAGIDLPVPHPGTSFAAESGALGRVSPSDTLNLSNWRYN
jgi:hypothetical protein